MQTTYRLKAKEITMAFLKSLRTQFAGQEVEIIIKPIEPKEKEFSTGQKKLLEMIKENRKNAPIIALNVDIQSLIDDAQYPAR
jgi:hypothetical protein